MYLINNFTMFNNKIKNYDTLICVVEVPECAMSKKFEILDSLRMIDLCTVCTSRFIDSCITTCL